MLIYCTNILFEGQRSFVTPLIDVIRVNPANATSLRVPCMTVDAKANITEPLLLALDKVAMTRKNCDKHFLSCLQVFNLGNLQADGTYKNVTTFRNWTTHYDPSIGFDVTLPVNSLASIEQREDLVGFYVCNEPVSIDEVQFQVIHSGATLKM